MPAFRPLLLGVCCSALLVSAAHAQPPILAPETVIADPAHDPSWAKLFQQLSAPKNRVSQFEERRHFPFREKPIVLTGEIRIIPDRGLSLNYRTPKAQTVIIDQSGVLLRDDRGRQREAPADSRAQAATSALFSILRFDLSALAKDFVVHGTRSEKAWALAFVPRDTALASLIGTVVVEGEDAHLNRIDLTKSDKQRIEIIIKNTIDDVIFGSDVVKEFFR